MQPSYDAGGGNISVTDLPPHSLLLQTIYDNEKVRAAGVGMGVLAISSNCIDEAFCSCIDSRLLVRADDNDTDVGPDAAFWVTILHP